MCIRDRPEAGDLDKPRMVFFFDEAHMLFRDAPTVLLQKVEQTVKLIRSRGVGVYFVTQSPGDIPDTVLAQLSNRVQHALRAYTPTELKAVRAAARAFRPKMCIRDSLQTVHPLAAEGGDQRGMHIQDAGGPAGGKVRTEDGEEACQNDEVDLMRRQQVGQGGLQGRLTAAALGGDRLGGRCV